MHWQRWLVPVLGLGLPIVLAVGGAGVLAHREALVVRLEAEEPAASAPRARLRLTVRNRIAAFVPVRGSGFSPAWRLEQRMGQAWEPVRTMESETETTWLLPYQRRRFIVSVEESGAYRAIVVSGVDGARSHRSAPVEVRVGTPGVQESDAGPPPFRH